MREIGFLSKGSNATSTHILTPSFENGESQEREKGRERKEKEKEKEKGTRQELRNGENKKANYLAVTYPRGEVSI